VVISVGDTAAGTVTDETADPSATERPFRVMPAVTVDNEHFWRGGAEGELRILRCNGCGYWIHPPAPICPECLGRDVAPQAVSGEANVLTFTVNRQLWYPNLDPPYVIAIVQLPEQADLRLTTNIVGCEPDDVAFGMPVRVVFEEYPDSRGSVWLPFFEPA
jgi:uncharacterized OB-fold protein